MEITILRVCLRHQRIISCYSEKKFIGNKWIFWKFIVEPETPPIWFTKFLDPAEFLFFALFFVWLAKTACSYKTDTQFLKTLRVWIISMMVLLIIFTPLVYLMSKGFQTIFDAFYPVSLTAAIIITIRMRQTIEAFGSIPEKI